MTITMIVWVLVVVSATIIGVFYYILTLQKRRQFGIMKATGKGRPNENDLKAAGVFAQKMIM